VHPRVEYLVAGLARGLRAVHRRVGVSEHVFGPVVAGAAECYAD
jgi:hypothetical protein